MDMNKKNIRFDDELQIEAYQFIGLGQNFPNHFHDYYVIGLIEMGERRLMVNHQEYRIGPGHLLTFNPMDNHACEQMDAGGLSYRCLNIKPEIMAGVTREVLGCETPPRFCKPTQYHTEFACTYQELHHSIMSGGPGLEKEELFLLFMQQLLSTYAEFEDRAAPQAVRKEVEDICSYLQQHYAERVSLEQLGEIAGLNKYTLLRTFTRFKGITPYRYLETIRIGKARELLEQNVDPAEVAQYTGFSDQSHFTRYFNQFIGLTPRQYQCIFKEDIE